MAIRPILSRRARVLHTAAWLCSRYGRCCLTGLSFAFTFTITQTPPRRTNQRISSLTTLGTDFSPFARILAVTKFLTVEAAQWVWNIYFNWYTEVTYLDMFRNSSCFKCDYESRPICIPSAPRFVLSEYVEDVGDTL